MRTKFPIIAILAVLVLGSTASYGDEKEAALQAVIKKYGTLLEASEKGNAEGVQALLAAGAKVDERNKDKQQSIHLAAIHGHAEVVKILLAAGAKATAKVYGVSPSDLAKENGHKELASYLAGEEAKEDAILRVANQKYVELVEAARKGDLVGVKSLLVAGADVKGKGRALPLLWAVSNEHENIEMVKVLLAAGAKVDGANDFGFQPIHYAAKNNYIQTVGVLLAAGAKVDAANMFGDQPIHEAAREGHNGMVKALLAATAKVNATNKYGQQPLHLAAQMGRAETVNFLLASGAKASIKAKDGATPSAMARGNIENVGSGNAAIASLLEKQEAQEAAESPSK